MISQDGNTRDESKMRRPELKGRLQAAWDRIDALEQENERLREALVQIACPERPDSVVSSVPSNQPLSRHYEQRAADALDGGGGDDE
jgi:hypothetical protein